MEFHTSFLQKRPIRLSETTRKFAYESLYEHKYGIETRKSPCVKLDLEDNIHSMSYLEKYNVAIRKIAAEAPIRICNDEKISCGATMGDSIDHWVPATLYDQHIFLGISHLTIDFKTVLDIGIKGIKQRATEKLLCFEDEKLQFIKSCISVIDSFEIWIKRYTDALKPLEKYENNYKNLLSVPFFPAKNFYQAVQSIWAVFAFCRLCGNWPGIGRLDQLLSKYLKEDLKSGLLTLEEAREILSHFFIKGCEWITGESTVSGDAQHYQNIVIGGCDENGNDITNEVTYLILDIVEELGISDFPISVRIGKNTPNELIHRVCEVMRYGNGIIAVYNEDLVIDALQHNGYSLKESRCFANDGCWEVLIPGKTYFTYVPFDALAVLQHKTMCKYSEKTDYKSFSELYNNYVCDLREQVKCIYIDRSNRLKNKNSSTISYEWNENVPCTVISLFESGCIEKGASYTNGGPEYTVISPHLGGLADVVNSLYAIKKLVYDEKRITYKELVKTLSCNWEGAEDLKYLALHQYKYYGNDNDEADRIAKDILSDYADACEELEKTGTFKFPAGVSTFGRQLDWAQNRFALPSGQTANSVLSNNMAPTPSTAFDGTTAIINSYCKSDLKRIPNGAALDVRLMPSDVIGDEGLNALCGIIKAFCSLGGFFIQIDVADSSVLRDAQMHPEKYPALAVRIAGWSARFVTLSREWQDMIINNIEKKDGV